MSISPESHSREAVELHNMEDNKSQIQSNSSLDLKNPIFQPKPGWGDKFNNWLRKNFPAWILPIIAVLVFIIGAYLYFTNRSAMPVPIVEDRKIETTENIEKVISSGQSITHVIRSTVVEYLVKNGIDMSAEQKIFMETYIVNQFANKHPRLGETLLIRPFIIRDAIDKAKSLNEYQLKAWSRYVK